MAKAKADISNTAARIFLQEFGAAYDEMRGLPRYVKAKHFARCGSSLANGAVTAATRSCRGRWLRIIWFL
jgi:hypothetical protein